MIKDDQLKSFIITYNKVKDLYLKPKYYVRAYNFLYGTQFTTEQLEKYLLLI